MPIPHLQYPTKTTRITLEIMRGGEIERRNRLQIFEIIHYENARILNIVRTSFTNLSLTVNYVKDSMENYGTLLGFSFSLLWFQFTLELTLWDTWRI